MEISTRGLGLAATSTLIQAAQAGIEHSDTTYGALTQVFSLIERGIYENLDWKTLGVPPELISPQTPQLVDYLMTAHTNWYNEACGVTRGELSTDFTEFVQPKWKSRATMLARDIPAALSRPSYFFSSKICLPRA